jgi:putative tryptophan/tyrosine transport system substrate-binding protein
VDTAASRRNNGRLPNATAFLVTRRMLGPLLLAGAASARGQPAARTWRLGFLGVGRPEAYASRIAALKEGLDTLGYREGRNLVIEFRWAEGDVRRLPALADELVAARPDVLVTHSTSGARVALRATATIPIVMADSGDPVGQGLVTSLARPGKNITGGSLMSNMIYGKRLEILKEIQPGLRRVAFVLNAQNAFPTTREQVREQAARQKVEPELIEIAAAQEIEPRLRDFKARRGEAVVMLDDPLFVLNMAHIADTALRHRIALAGFADYAGHGGLVGYGANFPHMYRRAATFIDKILRGARPGDLPIEQASQFELVVNVRTAHLLGLRVPHATLARADRVIE